MFAERRAKKTKSWNEELLVYLDQSMLMCEMFDPTTSKSSWVSFIVSMKLKY